MTRDFEEDDKVLYQGTLGEVLYMSTAMAPSYLTGSYTSGSRNLSDQGQDQQIPTVASRLTSFAAALQDEIIISDFQHQSSLPQAFQPFMADMFCSIATNFSPLNSFASTSSDRPTLSTTSQT